MKLKLTTSFFLVLLLFSCEQQSKVLQYDDISKELILNIENTVPNLVDSIKYIKLETNDDCLIGRISQIL
ncbi:MAG: 6-bladed beta-propeller, partial [Prevotellaceae bacterium]|nr:6-bladed beta-propeller [Prevotellaceae bacterium]